MLKNLRSLEQLCSLEQIRSPRHLGLALLLSLVTISGAYAQTKLFKAVAEDMDQEFLSIIQDRKLVGYLMFTQLERASADSFNYRLSIMDENLNDIGTVNFRDEKLNLKNVSFDQDILCLAYIKSNFVGKVYRNNKEFKKDRDNARSYLHTQFLSLDGKIIATNNIKLDIKPEAQDDPTSNRKVIGNGRLGYPIQLSNISGKGFACFYGDGAGKNLVVFNDAGKLMWKKKFTEGASNISMLTSGSDIDFLVKTVFATEGGWAVVSYNAIDSSAYPKILLKDKKGNDLKVITFDNDPVTGKPFVAGSIITPGKRAVDFPTGRNIVNGTYCGVFSIDLAGHTKKDIHTNFTYWNDGSQSFMDKNGYCEETRGYADFKNSFRDFHGNTWFAASNIHRHPRWGSIAGAVITAPLIFPPIFIMGLGTHRYWNESVTLIELDSAGKMKMGGSIASPCGQHYMAAMQTIFMNPRSYFNVSNPDSRSNYLIVDGAKDINIYNVNQKKVARNVPHKAGKNLVAIYPAKEGSIMVYEFDLKEKTTRLSIESL